MLLDLICCSLHTRSSLCKLVLSDAHICSLDHLIVRDTVSPLQALLNQRATQWMEESEIEGGVLNSQFPLLLAWSYRSLVRWLTHHSLPMLALPTSLAPLLARPLSYRQARQNSIKVKCQYLIVSSHSAEAKRWWYCERLTIRPALRRKDRWIRYSGL